MLLKGQFFGSLLHSNIIHSRFLLLQIASSSLHSIKAFSSPTWKMSRGIKTFHARRQKPCW